MRKTRVQNRLPECATIGFFCNFYIFISLCYICCLVCKTFKSLGFCCNTEEDIVVLLFSD